VCTSNGTPNLDINALTSLSAIISAFCCGMGYASILDRIGLDIIGPLPQTKRRNKYLLVVGDYFTRWMEAYPFPQQNAEMIADKLVN
jgi:hypothetical protein